MTAIAMTPEICTTYATRCTVCDYALLGLADITRGRCPAHCRCGQPLWAPLSIARGFCEACRIKALT